MYHTWMVWLCFHHTFLSSTCRPWVMSLRQMRGQFWAELFARPGPKNESQRQARSQCCSKVRWKRRCEIIGNVVVMFSTAINVDKKTKTAEDAIYLQDLLGWLVRKWLEEGTPGNKRFSRKLHVVGRFKQPPFGECCENVLHGDVGQL